MNNYLKSKYSNKNIYLIYYIIIAILTIYSTYKNGIILFQKNLINFVFIFKPLIFILLSLFIPFIINYIYNKYIIKKEVNINHYDMIFMALITLSLPLNTSIIIYSLLVIVFSIVKLFYKLDINYYSIFKLCIILILYLLGKYSYLTIYNLNIETSLSTLDIFLGLGVGGLATTNIFLLIICYLILLLNKTYKREIPIIAIISYLLTIIISALLFKSSIIDSIKYLLSGQFIFASILIATIPMFSPIKHKARIIYAISIGILSCIFTSILNNYDSIYIAIIISNLIIYLYNFIEKRIEK